MGRNLNPIVERLALLTDSDRFKVFSILDIIAECGWEDFPSRAVWEKKLKEKTIKNARLPAR
jgi:hypothetical protein